MFNRININNILKKHINTLYDYGAFKLTGKKIIPFSDLFIFLITPILLAIALYFLGIRVSETYVNILITALSIFIGLLFGLLTMIFDLAKKEKETKELLKENYKDENKYTLVKELFINTAFAIALSIITIISLLLTQFHPQIIIDYLNAFSWYINFAKTIIFLTNTIATFLVFQFLVTLLMILKRFFLLYLDQFDSKK